MDTKERLKHASEVLGWLAEGKELECRRTEEGACWQPAPDDEPGVEATVSIMAGRWEYRIKIEPVEFEADVQPDEHLDDVCWIQVPPGRRVKAGHRVRVTLLES